MFKAHILVGEGTDVAAELDRIADAARKHGLDDVKTYALMRNAEGVLAELKKQNAETAPYGIKISVQKHLKTEEYDIVFDLQPRRDGAKGGGFLSRLFGK